MHLFFSMSCFNHLWIVCYKCHTISHIISSVLQCMPSFSMHMHDDKRCMDLFYYCNYNVHTWNLRTDGCYSCITKRYLDLLLVCYLLSYTYHHTVAVVMVTSLLTTRAPLCFQSADLELPLFTPIPSFPSIVNTFSLLCNVSKSDSIIGFLEELFLPDT